MSSSTPAGPWYAFGALFVAMVAILVGATLLAIAGGVGPVLAGVLVAGSAVWGTTAAVRAQRLVVSAAVPKVDGKLISGRGAELLADIMSRFDYAGRLVDEIPTGIDWAEVKPDVEVLVWSAAEHAAQFSQFDRDVFEMRYAEPGTPQAAFRRTLEERRHEHEVTLLDIQREAEDLARHAGNAAAAARMALALTGDVRTLDVIAPSARELQARDAIGEAKKRLELLTAAWSELDPTGAIAAEALTPTHPVQPSTRASTRRRKS